MNSNWSYSPETVKLGRDLCDLDLWPWPFAWTSLLSLVITPENFMMIGWWEHSQKGVTDRQTDGQTDRQTDGRTDWTIHRAAWSQLKINVHALCLYPRCNVALQICVGLPIMTCAKFHCDQSVEYIMNKHTKYILISLSMNTTHINSSKFLYIFYMLTFFLEYIISHGSVSFPQNCL